MYVGNLAIHETSGTREDKRYSQSVAVSCRHLQSLAVTCSHLQSAADCRTCCQLLFSLSVRPPHLRSSIHHGRWGWVSIDTGLPVAQMRARVVLYWWIVSALVRDALGGAVGLISFCLSHQNFQVNSCRRASGRQFGNELCIGNQLCMPLPLQRKSGKASRTNCWKYNSAAEALVWMLRCYDIIIVLIVIILL